MLADQLDQAAEYEEFFINNSLANRVVYSGTSLEFCRICDDRIPVARQEAIQGVSTCIFCQSKAERK